MGTYIIKLADHYLEWSSVVDAPVTNGMTLDEYKEFYRDEYGRANFESVMSDGFAARMKRVEERGTSAFDDKTVEDTIWLNRAGPKEKPLHKEEIIEFYIRRKQSPKEYEKELAKFREGLARCGPSCVSIERDGCGEFCPKCWGTDFVRPQ